MLINQSIHTLDLMVHALGRPVKVTASIKNVHLRDVIEVEDSAELLLYYPGFTAKFTATTAAKGSYPVVTNFYTDAGIAETRGDEFTLSGEKSGRRRRRAYRQGRVGRRTRYAYRGLLFMSCRGETRKLRH